MRITRAAVLSKLVGEVYSIEIVPQLARWSAETLSRLGFRNGQGMPILSSQPDSDGSGQSPGVGKTNTLNRRCG